MELHDLKCENDCLRKKMAKLSDALEAARAKCELLSGDFQEAEKELNKLRAENNTFRYCISSIFGTAQAE